MSDLADYYLASRIDVAQLELLELTHPNFTRPYRIVRQEPENLEFVIVDLAPDQLAVRFDYWPAKFQAGGARDDLDFRITINLGDLGEVLPNEIDAVTAAGGLGTKIAIRYWVYRSDDLTAPIMGPVRLEGPAITSDGQFSTIEARSPSLNNTKTGERYKIERFRMLRGFLR